ncbi:hypothetical protein ACFLUU_06180 [Chloroflexota bacterium]
MEEEMNIFSSRRGKNQREKNIFDDKMDSKVQFNVLIEAEIKSEIQKMRKIFRVNQSAMSEHLLEVGLHHISKAVEDPDKRKLLEKHLEISHLLDENDRDEAIVIRMTENSNNWILLDYTRHLTLRINRITQTMHKAVIMKDMDTFEKAEKELNREMAKFASWVMELRGDAENED